MKPSESIGRRLAIYVPSRDCNGNDLPQECGGHDALVNDVANTLSQRYGGATAIPGWGCWRDGQGRLIRECVTIVYTFATLPQIEAKWLQEYAQRQAKRWQQACVMIEVDGEAIMVYPQD